MALTDDQIAQQLIDDLSGEFSAYTTAQLNPYVAEARFSVSEAFWGTRYDLAVKLMAGHVITNARAGSSGSTGPVSSRSAGELSESYATPEGSIYTGVYSTTGWGRRYAELLASQRYAAAALVI